MGAGGEGIQCHAGVLNADETLTPRAKQLFIEEVRNECMLGTVNFDVAFPCGPKIPANPFADQLSRLEDETIFPDFHKQIIKGQYEKVAAEMNLAGGMSLLPICDPLALAFTLGIDIDAPSFPDGFIEFMIPNPPKLALMLDIMPPPKLAAKFPNLMTIPPKIPAFALPKIPNVQFDPNLNIDLGFAAKLPKVILDIIGKIPDLALNLPSPPDLFSVVCEASQGLFDISPEAIVKIAAYKVLTRKVAEMILFVAVGKTLGSSPAGIVGGLGRAVGYSPPPEEHSAAPRNPRDRIVAYAETMLEKAFSWGNKDDVEEDYTVQDMYVMYLLPTEWGDGSPKNILPKSDPQYDPRVIGKQQAIMRSSNLSSCGMFVRACYANGGATHTFLINGQPEVNKNKKINRYYDFFLDEYRIINGGGVAIVGLAQAAKTKGAFIQPVKGDLPPLKRGDCIVVYDKNVGNREHVILVTEDYNAGSFELHTIEGGQVDKDNSNRPTAIWRKRYVNITSSEFSSKAGVLENPFAITVDGNNDILIDNRYVRVYIDGEIMCTNKVGSDTANPIDTLTATTFDSNDPQADADAGRLPAPDSDS